MNCSDRTIRVMLVSAAILLGGCGQKISRFEVMPVPTETDDGAVPSSGVVRICAGERVAARWKVDGEPVMLLRSSGPARQPDAMAQAPDTLEVTLVVDPGPDEELRTVLVLEYPATAPDKVGFQTRAVRGDTVIASGDKSADPRFTVQQVANSSDRPIEVRHADKREWLRAGAASTSFNGTPASGAWELRSILTRSELETPHLRPGNLLVDIIVRCIPEEA